MLKKVLVTGGSGFVGRNLIERLLKNKDFSVYNLSRTAVDLPGVVNIPLQQDLIIPELGNGFDYIIHTLALSNDRYCGDFDYAESVNIAFTKRIFQFASHQEKLKKIVHISSIILYDNINELPVKENGNLKLDWSNYSFTKGIAEKYAQYFSAKHSLPTIIFRLSNIYGPFQKISNSPFLVPSKIEQAIKQGAITVFNDKPKRDWIYAPDAADAIVKSLDSDFKGLLNLGCGQGISVGELIGEIAKQLNVEFKSENKPMTGPQNFYCDISEIKKAIGWKPVTDIGTGMAKTIEYYKNEIENI